METEVLIIACLLVVLVVLIVQRIPKASGTQALVTTHQVIFSDQTPEISYEEHGVTAEDLQDAIACIIPQENNACPRGFVPHDNGCCRADYIGETPWMDTEALIATSIVVGFLAEEMLEAKARWFMKHTVDTAKRFGRPNMKFGIRQMRTVVRGMAQKAAKAITKRAVKSAAKSAAKSAFPTPLLIIDLLSLGLDLWDPWNLNSYTAQEDVDIALRQSVDMTRNFAKDLGLPMVDDQWTPCGVGALVRSKCREADQGISEQILRQNTEKLQSETDPVALMKLTNERKAMLAGTTDLYIEAIYQAFETKFLHVDLPVTDEHRELFAFMDDTYDSSSLTDEEKSARAYEYLERRDALEQRQLAQYALDHKEHSIRVLIESIRDVCMEPASHFRYVDLFPLPDKPETLDDVFGRMLDNLTLTDDGIERLKELDRDFLSAKGKQDVEGYLSEITFYPVMAHKYMAVTGYETSDRGQTLPRLERTLIDSLQAYELTDQGLRPMTTSTCAMLTGYWLPRDMCEGFRDGNKGQLIKCHHGTGCRTNIDPTDFGVRFNDAEATCHVTDSYCSRYGKRFVPPEESRFGTGDCEYHFGQRTMQWLAGDTISAMWAEYGDGRNLEMWKDVHDEIAETVCTSRGKQVCSSALMLANPMTSARAAAYYLGDTVADNANKGIDNLVDCYANVDVDSSTQASREIALCMLKGTLMPLEVVGGTVYDLGNDVYKAFKSVNRNKGLSDVKEEYNRNCLLGLGERIDKEACKAYKRDILDRSEPNLFRFRMEQPEDPNHRSGKDCYCPDPKDRTPISMIHMWDYHLHKVDHDKYDLKHVVHPDGQAVLHYRKDGTPDFMRVFETKDDGRLSVWDASKKDEYHVVDDRGDVYPFAFPEY